MPDLNYLQGKKFAVIMIKGENDWAFFVGIAKWHNGELLIDRGLDTSEFRVPYESFHQIKPTDIADREELEGAEYCTVMLVETLTDEVDPVTLERTDLTWPENSE
ncbi:MAG: hypothetical protein M3Y82_09420 [Verrucomicrobiota bacterium]|nr:hypothetical protein [Verrucomicrobiota bacterium]